MKRLDSVRESLRLARQALDGASVSAQRLAQAQAEGHKIIGPAQPAPHQAGRFSVEDVAVQVEARQAVCPAGTCSTQCSRLAAAATGKVSCRSI